MSVDNGLPGALLHALQITPQSVTPSVSQSVSVLGLLMRTHHVHEAQALRMKLEPGAPRSLFLLVCPLFIPTMSLLHLGLALPRLPVSPLLVYAGAVGGELVGYVRQSVSGHVQNGAPREPGPCCSPSLTSGSLLESRGR